MKVSAIATAAAFAGVASAQNIITVMVGMSGNGTAGNFFSPSRVTAAVGDTIQFQFMGGNHSVTQSTFDSPCIPISMSNASVVGVHSDFIPAAQALDQGMLLAWNLQINDTRPLWLYCAQGRHCQSGMGMVINENSAANQTRTLDTYLSQAANVQQALAPSGALGGVANTNPNGAVPGANGNADPNATGDDAQGAAASVHASLSLLVAAAGAALLF